MAASYGKLLFKVKLGDHVLGFFENGYYEYGSFYKWSVVNGKVHGDSSDDLDITGPSNGELVPAIQLAYEKYVADLIVGD